MGDAGVVQQDVEPAEACDRRVHAGLGEGACGDVARHEVRRRAEFGRQCGARRLVAVGEHHACALQDEAAHTGRTDAVGAAGDQGNAILQFHEKTSGSAAR